MIKNNVTNPLHTNTYKEPIYIANYFTIEGLIKETHMPDELLPYVVYKELMDNALDALEPLKESKQIKFIIANQILAVYDNGAGLTKDIISDIYDFGNYVSSHRHAIVPSRGKQGNGLKIIIGLCYIKGWDLLWHTNTGDILRANINSDKLQDGIVEITLETLGKTKKKGLEIKGFNTNETIKQRIIYDMDRYWKCNRDVSFECIYEKNRKLYPGNNKLCRDKSQSLALTNFDISTYKNYIKKTQNKDITYKQFLQNNFGTKVSHKSKIKSKIKDLDFNSPTFLNDFCTIRNFQNTKKYTLLRNHLMGLSNTITTNIKIIDHNPNAQIKEWLYPCLIEYSVVKNKNKNDVKKGSHTNIDCYINNTITYFNGNSIRFSENNYEINNKLLHADNLQGLLKDFSNFTFQFHFIGPVFIYTDPGKTQIDITSIIEELIIHLSKSIKKANREFSNTNKIKKDSKREIMRKHITSAFSKASDNGRYSITARQIWYKLREITQIQETDNTYRDFTQKILTEWLDNNPDSEEKVNFSDRGNCFFDGEKVGLGTSSVNKLLKKMDISKNVFECYSDLDKLNITTCFAPEYKYDKVLYIEKTGFDDIFLSEKLCEKYHMILVSGQGYATRAAKTLLYELEKKGLTIYCMHDLDISGYHIIKSLAEPNDKFNIRCILLI